jgi:hypothetical protein
MKVLNKLVCYNTIGSNGLLVENPLAYWVDSWVKKKMECCEFGHQAHIHKTPFELELMKVLNKLVCYNTLGCNGLLV